MSWFKKFLSIFGVKSFFLICIIIMGTLDISAEVKTVINSIEKNGKQINGGKWNSFTANQNDSLTFYFSLKENNSSINKNVIYKIFLTGSSSVPELDSYKNEYYTLKNLKAGEYLFKVQGFINGNIETTPAIVRFSISENGNNEAVNTSINSSEVSSIPIYVSVAILLIVVAGVIIILFVRKNRVKQNTAGVIKTSGSSKPARTISYVKHEKSTIENTSEEESKIIEEQFDYKYAYDSLKKENEKLKNENTFLRGQIDGLMSNVNDLETANSQLAKQKDRLLESKRQVEELHAHKEELFTIALHDIKNPAAAIKGFVELLESYDLNANEQQEIMHSLVDTSSKILELAQEMSVVLAKQTDEPVITPEKASVKVITDAVCRRNYAYAKKKGINIINNTSPNTPETLIDVNKIEEVIDNLINNSIKYSLPGTIVYVRSFFSGSKITIEVEDNGVGLNEDDIKKAFRKGVLLSSKPTGDETRSGLGLWISKKIIEDHGGKIWIKSKFGIGTTVGFDLPIKR